MTTTNLFRTSRTTSLLQASSLTGTRYIINAIKIAKAADANMRNVTSIASGIADLCVPNGFRKFKLFQIVPTVDFCIDAYIIDQNAINTTWWFRSLALEQNLNGSFQQGTCSNITCFCAFKFCAKVSDMPPRGDDLVLVYIQYTPLNATSGQAKTADQACQYKNSLG